MSSMGDRKAALNLAALAGLSTLSFGCAPGVTPEEKMTLKSVQPVARAFADVGKEFEHAFGLSRDWASALGNGAQIVPDGFRAGSAEQKAALLKAAAELVKAIEALNGGNQSEPKQAR